MWSKWKVSVFASETNRWSDIADSDYSHSPFLHHEFSRYFVKYVDAHYCRSIRCGRKRWLVVITHVKCEVLQRCCSACVNMCAGPLSSLRFKTAPPLSFPLCCRSEYPLYIFNFLGPITWSLNVFYVVLAEHQR